MEETLELTIPETTNRSRVDKVAVSLVGDRLTRTQLKNLIEDGDLLVDGEQVRPSSKVGPGQCITIIIPSTPPSTVVAQDIPIDVVYEDDDMLVVNKPPGLVVHPAPGNHDSTLVNALMFHRGIACGDPGRPGIVHRLDKDTSGLMLVAKTESSLRKLSAMIAERHVTREYLALVRGIPPFEGSIETPYGRHPRDRKRFTSRIRGDNRASTRYKLVRGFGDATALVRLTLGTGRTHQIRVHMSESGWPLIGDPIYSRLPKKGGLRDICEKAGRTMLHATHLELSHPETGSWLEFDKEAPADFQGVLASLEAL